MSSPPPDLDAMVRAVFAVKDTFRLPAEGVEYLVAYDTGSRANFSKLSAQLTPLGWSAQLRGSEDACTLTLSKAEARGPSRSRIPVILALFTVAAVLVFGLLQQTLYEALAPGIPGSAIFVGFSLAALALFLGHELSRRFAARRGNEGVATEYLIPGVPFLPPFLPTLGFVVSQRWPAVNRDALFDMLVAGPLAVIAVSVVYAVLGEVTAFQSTLTLASSSVGNSTIFVNPNIIQMGISAAFGAAAPQAQPGFVLLSPLGDVATVGFILAFVLLLPMSIFEGGHLGALVLGQRGHRVATYLSVLLLLALDTPTYWTLAIVVLVIAGRSSQTKVLDEVSALSRSRRYLYFGVLVLAFLCVPLPGNFATFPLG